MSEALIGVIVGGIIASIVPLVTLFLNFQKWKKELKIVHLKEKREALRKLFWETSQELTKSMVDDSYSVEMATNVFRLFPEKVQKAFGKMTGDKSKRFDVSQVKVHYLNIVSSMKESLSDIDAEILKMIES